METRWKWDGGDCSDTRKAREGIQYLVLAQIHLDFPSWCWLQTFGGEHGFVLVPQIALWVLRFHMVCHRFCPQALAEALKVNKTVTDINLRGNEIGNEGAKAWCLAGGSVDPWKSYGIKWCQWCTSGVRDFCETLVLLDGCSGVRPLVLATIQLDFDSWSSSFGGGVTWLYVGVADCLLGSQVSHGVPSFLSTGPCRSIESQQDCCDHRLGT